jgi:fanconi anemia group M protein
MSGKQQQQQQNGWQCTKCTYQHYAPGTRCAMCNELRVSKTDLANFIAGKPIPLHLTENNGHCTMMMATATWDSRGGKSGGSSSSNASHENHRLAAIATNNKSSGKSSNSRKPSPPMIPIEKNNAAAAVSVPLEKNNAGATNKTKKTPFTVAAKAAGQSGPQRMLPYQPGPVPYDPATASTWIYPTSDVYEKRRYQFEMAERALSHNTLVSLPTGLGKTLIAAVVLYNYYRWFPTGKVLFLAPTVPLVDQQLTACYEIMGIPAADTAILTGKVPARQREEIYKTKRVFFGTPQTIQKDLENDRLDQPHSIVCLVLDEAHKAVGEYAYCKVVELLAAKAGAQFRLLGLSATPGTSIQAIQQVICKLRINCIECRTDDDVQQYVHDVQSETVVVAPVNAAKSIQRLLDDLLQPLLDRLKNAKAMQLVGNATITPYCLFKARELYEARRLRQSTSTSIDQQPHGGDSSTNLTGYFCAAHTVAKLRFDLHRLGLGVVRSQLLQLQNNRPRGGILANLVKSAKFHELCQEVATATSTTDAATGQQTHDRLKNNPKLEKLREILLEHFARRQACDDAADGDGGSGTKNSTRAIVFSQFRDSVGEIEQALQNVSPLIRPRHFVGQGKGAAITAGANKDNKQDDDDNSNKNNNIRGMKQEEQKRVIQEFRAGTHNVLVCTCIGEEGLDIGEVDLIVNFDCLSSPIRMIQRVGRTGRKRNGASLADLLLPPRKRYLF